MEQLASIALKNRIDPETFFDLVMEAWNKQEAKSRDLTVTCRQKTKESAFFLFTEGDKISAQLPISTETLQRELERYLKYRLQSGGLESVKRVGWSARVYRGRPSQGY